jgi:hypothetical protein
MEHNVLPPPQGIFKGLAKGNITAPNPDLRPGYQNAKISLLGTWGAGTESHGKPAAFRRMHMFSGHRGEFLWLGGAVLLAMMIRQGTTKTEDKLRANVQTNGFRELKGASSELSRWTL